MSYIGNSINVVLAALVGLSVLGTAGATVYYQHDLSDVRQENRELEEDNAQLRADLADAQSRTDELREARNQSETRVSELEASLESRRSDVEELSERVSELEEQLEESGNSSGGGGSGARVPPSATMPPGVA